MLKSKWQWVNNTFGPMGWFTDVEKQQHENTPEFSNGIWVALSPEEVTNMNHWIGQMAYEQS